MCVCLPTPAQGIIIMSLSLVKYKFNAAVQYEIYKYIIYNIEVENKKNYYLVFKLKKFK